MKRFPIIDTHTGGEPTRVLIAADWCLDDFGLRALGTTEPDARARRNWLRQHADWVRRCVIGEPRGSECMVGAWVLPAMGDVAAQVIFFNNVGYLGMCGHGLIGVLEALRHHRGLPPGEYSFDTPAGIVKTALDTDAQVTFENVPSYRFRSGVPLTLGRPPEDQQNLPHEICGDIAYGGNWFFIATVGIKRPTPIDVLMRYSQRIREALVRDNITGENGAEIDHIELSLPVACIADRPPDSRCFVLCPGGHYDRSPCGTGTSAKVACLAADGRLEPGQSWCQESIIGSQFTARYRPADASCSQNGRVVVSIRGRAHVTAETVCVLDPEDPFMHGIKKHLYAPEMTKG